MRVNPVVEKIRLGKFIHGGQALSETSDGKKLLVWNGLPGELVDVQIYKKKKSYAEGIAVKIHKTSKYRINPVEPESYTSTSPWQIISFEYENTVKQEILSETFSRLGVKNVNFLPFVSSIGGSKDNNNEYNYRNKMEFGFWGDDDGLHLAHYVRGTHGKAKVESSALAIEQINSSALLLRDELNKLSVWGGKLKTLILRCSKAGEVVGALFVKEEIHFDDFKLPKGVKGLDIYFSNPMSPASIPTKKLHSFGDIKLTDSINDINITYDVLSFFQVNLPMFELTLKKISEELRLSISNKSAKINILDMYSGVGTIGIVIGASVLVEPDEYNVEMAKSNIGNKKIELIRANSENSLEYISKNTILILDPPRAGIHIKVVDRILEVKPPMIIYLSCNPATQARDIEYLLNDYDIKTAQGFNYFPRTPHIESLLVLKLKV